MTVQYGVTRLEEDGVLSNAEKMTLAEAERQLFNIEKELSTIEPRVEQLQKQRVKMRSRVQQLKNQAGSSGHAQMNGEKPFNMDDLSPRQRFIAETENAWQGYKGPARSSHADQEDDDVSNMSPRDKFLRDNENAWRKGK